MWDRSQIKVLLIDDEEDDLVDTRDLLSNVHHVDFVVDRAPTYEAGVAQILRQQHDVYLIDSRLGAKSGLDLLRVAQVNGCRAPIIVLTGRDDREIDVEAMRMGASDFLVKGRIDAETLERSIRYAVERKRIELSLAHQATHDPLTELPNRTLFIDRLRQALARLQRNRSQLAVMLLDIDGFKTINDNLGHAVGDQLLVAIAKRLSGALRPMDTIARFGGDEFTILCEDLATPETAIKVAERLLSMLGPSFPLDSNDVFITASIGIARATEFERKPEDLLRDADAAMYAAKGHRGLSIEMFSE
ncbi:MAG: diguanylate cyclase domain-containing protein, partial [Acidimicrobiia bacterium]